MTVINAVRRLIDEDLIPRIKVEPRENLRHLLFFTKDVDRLFKSNKEQL